MVSLAALTTEHGAYVTFVFKGLLSGLTLMSFRYMTLISTAPCMFQGALGGPTITMGLLVGLNLTVR